MAKEIPSVDDLRRESEGTDDEIEAPTAAYLKDEAAKPFVFKSGHRIEVAKPTKMYPQTKKLLADNATTEGFRRAMVKTAIIMSFPVRA